MPKFKPPRAYWMNWSDIDENGPHTTPGWYLEHRNRVLGPFKERPNAPADPAYRPPEQRAVDKTARVARALLVTFIILLLIYAGVSI